MARNRQKQQKKTSPLDKVQQVYDKVANTCHRWTSRIFWLVILYLAFLIVTSDFTIVSHDEDTGHTYTSKYTGAKGFKAARATNHALTYGHGLDGSVDVTYSKNFINLRVIKVDAGLGIKHTPGRGPAPRLQFTIRF